MFDTVGAQIEAVELIARTLDEHHATVQWYAQDQSHGVRCSCPHRSKWSNARAAYQDARDHQAEKVLAALQAHAQCPSTSKQAHVQCQIIAAIPHDWHAAPLANGAVLSWKD